MTKKKSAKDQVFDRLVRLPNVSSCIRFLRRRRLLAPSTVRRLGEEVSLLVRIDLNKARRLGAVAVRIATRLGHPESRPSGPRARANSLWFRGRNAQA